MLSEEQPFEEWRVLQRGVKAAVWKVNSSNVLSEEQQIEEWRASERGVKAAVWKVKSSNVCSEEQQFEEWRVLERRVRRVKSEEQQMCVVKSNSLRSEECQREG